MITPRPVAVLAATAAALLTWTIAVPLAGAELTTTAGEVGLLAVAVSATVVGLAGWGLLTVLERATTRPRVIWTYIAATVLLLSLAGPLVQATTGTAKIALMAMHLTTGLVLIALLPRRSARPGAMAEPVDADAELRARIQNRVE